MFWFSLFNITFVRLHCNTSFEQDDFLNEISLLRYFWNVKFHVCLENPQTAGLKIFGHILLRHLTSTKASTIYWHSVGTGESSESDVVFIWAFTVGI